MQNIAIFFGGPSSESDISAVSASYIYKIINRKKFNVYAIYISENKEFYLQNNIDFSLDHKPKFDLRQKLNILHGGYVVNAKDILSYDGVLNNMARPLFKIDIAFPVMHGAFGEDGVFAGFLETLDIKYIGSSSISFGIGFNKYLTKIVLENAGLLTAPYKMITIGNYLSNKNEEVNKILKFSSNKTVYIKPAREGSSIGVNQARNKEEILHALNDAFKYDSCVLIEKEIIGREIECAVIGMRGSAEVACAAGEVLAEGGFYSKEQKYFAKTDNTVVPSCLSDKQKSLLFNAAKCVFLALGARSLMRVDMFLTGDDKVFINEVNMIPGFTPSSMFLKIWESSGVKAEELINRLAFDALATCNTHMH